jgi:uncharacterized protein YbjQ (UPF0145 family)
MEDVAGIVFGLFWLLVVIGLPIAFIVTGRIREKNHFEDIARREAIHHGFPVIDISLLPAGMTASRGELVTGQVVIASDYLKNFFAQYRQLFGGEMKSYQTMMQRGKAEARLRMIEEAKRLGATAVINVRFETSQIGQARGKAGAMSEVLCYGTAVMT